LICLSVLKFGCSSAAIGTQASGLQQMKPSVKVAFVGLISLLWIQPTLCDVAPNTSSLSNWTCTCYAQTMSQSNILASNCSTSCNCTSATGGADQNKWTCVCAADGFPVVVIDNGDTSCFTGCNCTSALNFFSGNVSEAQPSKRGMSSKVVVIVLLLCVVLTTLAFVASVVCYVYQRDKCPIPSSMLPWDRETSCNSATKLISYKTISLPEARIDIGSPTNLIAGCFYKASMLFRSKAERLHGVITQFSYAELDYATDKFSNSNLIGVGGSSYVYCGHLKDGRTVAVKRLKNQDGPDADIIFLTEIELISRLHHCHVVPLLGYCSESQGKHAERLLVFEYMPNGNLRDCLDGTSGGDIDWSTRVAIALGAARGLEYLHEAAAPRILHRDVKSTNILLDENWRAKITDLGMAKSIKTDGVNSCSSSPARMQGTFGYFAPEYANVGRASLKSDVFSFGVVLLELISGRQAIHKSTKKGEESLVIWATPRLKDSKRVISELPDPRLKRGFPEEEMQIMAYLAKECLLLDPECRPTMSEVVQILSTIAPGKSRKRNFPVTVFLGSTHGLKCDPVDFEDTEIQAPPITAEELKRTTSNDRWSPRCSLPVSIDRALCIGNYRIEADHLSAEYIERLILLSSKARSWHTQDDETVDLTEPRLESFCMANFKSP
ncbi:Protein kinase domain, partial [Dillenia turbinata]